MATKRDVEVLNNEAPAFARLGAGGANGFGTLLNSMIDTLNRVANQVVGLSAGVAIAGTASKVKTGVAVQYLAGGVYCKKGVTDDFWTLTGPNIAAGNARKYLLLIDAAGAASVLASDDRLIADVAQCAFPALPANRCCLGVVQIENATNPFVPGTTLLSAAGVTDTYTDGHPAAVPGSPTVPVLA